MNKSIVLFCLFSMIAYAGNSTLKLSGLKPTQKSGVELGQLSVELISVGDGKVVSTFSGKFGDCNDCFRGASVKGDLGVRFEGNTIGSLVSTRKQTSRVKLTSCDLKDKFQDNKIICEFKLHNQPMKLVFSIAP